MTLKELEQRRQALLEQALQADLPDYKLISLELSSPSREDLSEHMSTLPSSYAWWATMYENCSAELRKAKLDFEIWYSEQYSLQAEILGQTGRKPTIKDVESSVTTLPEYKERQTRLVELERSANILKRLLEALELKHEAMIQLGAHFRREMELAGGIHTPLNPPARKG